MGRGQNTPACHAIAHRAAAGSICSTFARLCFCQCPAYAPAYLIFQLSSFIIGEKTAKFAVFFARARRISVFFPDKRKNESVFEREDFTRGPRDGEAWRYFGLLFRDNGDILFCQSFYPRKGTVVETKYLNAEN